MKNNTSSFKIGLTEWGDPSVNYTWIDNMKYVQGAILITKNITDKFISEVLKISKEKPVIVHCTCTGWGGTIIEPGVPPYKTQLNQLKKMTETGFPAERVVLRIDPIYPSINGLKRVHSVLTYCFDTLKIPIGRIRISVIDEYKHVKQRYKEAGLPNLYGDSFQASQEQLELVNSLLEPWSKKLNIKFELCAENALFALAQEKDCYAVKGCVNKDDVEKLMGLKVPNGMPINGQHRSGCSCLDCKLQLIKRNSGQCPHKCIYCYIQNR